MNTSASALYKYLSISEGIFGYPPEITGILNRIQESCSLDRIEQLAGEALAQAHGLPGLWALTEAQVGLGLRLDELQYVDKSAVYLKMAAQAGDRFSDLGALQWTLGNQQYRLRQNEAARWSWMRAIESFQNARNFAAQNKKMPNLVDFFKDRLEWMRDQQFSTMECAYYDCIYRFDAGRPNSTTFETQAMQLQELVRAGQFGEARLVIDRFDAYGRTISQREEKLLIQVRCGMALWQMGNQDLAIQRLHDVAGCYAGTLQHQEAVTRWMLGIVEWEEPELKGDAISHWERACDLFVRLDQQADRRNQQDRRPWYAENVQRMRRMLMRRIKGRDIP